MSSEKYLDKDILKSIVKDPSNINVCLNIKKKTISSLEFSGDEYTYSYKKLRLFPFIDWKPAFADDTYIASVRIEINSLDGDLILKPV